MSISHARTSRPLVHASAPGRGGIVGNPSDIYGGTVVSCTIPERAEAVISPSPRIVLDITGQYQVVESDIDLEYDDELHFLDVGKAVWRFLRRSHYAESGAIDPSATFHVRANSNIPIKAGCAGSTAMLMSILGGLLAHFGVVLERHEFAELARDIERHELGIHCGYQDQYMIAFGGLNCIDLRGKENHAAGREAPYATVEPLLCEADEQLPFILANSGVQRSSGAYHAQPRSQWEQGDERHRAGYARIGELGRIGKKALLQGDWPWLGELMNENCAIMRDLVGCGEVNEHLITVANEAGALGAKLAGAGRGGTIIALHPEPTWLGERLLEAGAERLIFMRATPGLIVELAEASGR